MRKVEFLSFWMEPRIIFLLTIFVTAIKSDSRCFLRGGGSSLLFFVSEDAQVGANVGLLDITGEVSSMPGGARSISLRLSEGSTAPVRIEPGTKNLTLTRRLDREGVAGPSGATFTVLCDRVNRAGATTLNNDPSIQIPVSIRVIDVNDNAPRWIGGPFSINISEQNLPGSMILSGLKALDMDQAGPHSNLAFSALDPQGKPSSLVSFTGGGLEGTLVLNRPLDFESQPEFNVTLRVQDHGTPPLYSDTLLRVKVKDADDQNPRFKFVSYSALLPPSSQMVTGSQLVIEPEPISAFDQDTGINAPVIFSMPEGRPESQFFSINPRSGVILLKKNIPDDKLTQSVTLVLKAEQIDNPDRYALSTLSVGRKGHQSSPLHFVQQLFEINVPENSPPNTILLTALTSRPSDSGLKFSVQGDPGAHFGVGSMGQLILVRTLDFETQQKHLLKIWVNDGFRNASTTVNVNVLNVNDWGPRFRQSLYEFNVTSDIVDQGAPLGQIEVADGDLGDSLTLEIKNTEGVQVDPYGRLYITNKSMIKREMMFLVVAKDAGDPPREAFVPVVLRLTDLPTNEEIYMGEIDMKIAIISAIVMVVLSLGVGTLLYFAYCRKRRKIESENYQKRVLDHQQQRNGTSNVLSNNPLAIALQNSSRGGGKIKNSKSTNRFLSPNGGNNSFRRSNKIRNMALNITGPAHLEQNNLPNRSSNVCLTPLDPVTVQNPLINNSNNTATIRAKNVTWSPKTLDQVENGPRNNNLLGGLGGFEIDPDTSVTPLNDDWQKNRSDTLQSNSSLTVYF